MRIILTAFAVILILSRSYSQGRESEAPRLSLRTSLLAPLESDANLVLGLGVQWKSRWAAIVDAGYIFSRHYDNNSSFTNERDQVNGLKLRTEFRYYFRDLVYSGRTTFYVAPVFHYKKVRSERWEEFGMDCTNGNCNYFQIDTYKRVKQELGGILTVGTFSPLFGGNRVAIETSIGLGIKVKKHWNTDFPPGATLFNEPGTGLFSTDRDGNFPMIPLGVRISFRLF